jgi:hypothetical protein
MFLLQNVAEKLFKFIDRFRPKMLEKFDQQLLIHFPILWAMRLHYGLFFIGITGFLLLLSEALFPCQLTGHLTNPDETLPLVILCMALPVLIWGILAIQHSPIQQYGIIKPVHSILQLVGNCFIITAAVFMAMLYSYLGAYQLAHTITPQTLNQDLITLNQGDALLHIGQKELLSINSEILNEPDPNQKHNLKSEEITQPIPREVTNNWMYDGRLLFFYRYNDIRYDIQKEKIALVKKLQALTRPQATEWLTQYLETMKKYGHPIIFDRSNPVAEYKEGEEIQYILNSFFNRPLPTEHEIKYNINPPTLPASVFYYQRSQVQQKILLISRAQSHQFDVQKIDFWQLAAVCSFYIALALLFFSQLGVRAVAVAITTLVTMISFSFLMMIIIYFSNYSGRQVIENLIMIISYALIIILTVYTLKPLRSRTNKNLRALLLTWFTFVLPLVPFWIVFTQVAFFGYLPEKVLPPAELLLYLGVLLTVIFQPVIQKRIREIKALPQ